MFEWAVLGQREQQRARENVSNAGAAPIKQSKQAGALGGVAKHASAVGAGTGNASGTNLGRQSKEESACG